MNNPNNGIPASNNAPNININTNRMTANINVNANNVNNTMTTDPSMILPSMPYAATSAPGIDPTNLPLNVNPTLPTLPTPIINVTLAKIHY